MNFLIAITLILVDLYAIFCHPIHDECKRGSRESLSVEPSSMRTTRQAVMKLKLEQGLRLMDGQKLRECTARVICQLQCNPTGFGVPGQRTYRAMHKLHSDVASKDPRIVYFRNAGDKGDELRPNCHKCEKIYANCARSTFSLLSFAQRIQIVSD